jgi:hypothetical protein
MSEETVTIPKSEYESLKKDSEWLICLEAAGVDNWDGYDCAVEMREADEEAERTKVKDERTD